VPTSAPLVVGRDGATLDLVEPWGVEIVQGASYDGVRARLAQASIAVCPRSERSRFPIEPLNHHGVASAADRRPLAARARGAQS
jgi:hypothetical protein